MVLESMRLDLDLLEHTALDLMRYRKSFSGFPTPPSPDDESIPVSFADLHGGTSHMEGLPSNHWCIITNERSEEIGRVWATAKLRFKLIREKDLTSGDNALAENLTKPIMS